MIAPNKTRKKNKMSSDIICDQFLIKSHHKSAFNSNQN